jgi:hypothetical protein
MTAMRIDWIGGSRFEPIARQALEAIPDATTVALLIFLESGEMSLVLPKSVTDGRGAIQSSVLIRALRSFADELEHAVAGHVEAAKKDGTS